MKIVSVEQMQCIESAADRAGVSYEKMMHNAGKGVAEWVNKYFSDRPIILGLIGSGNNGGDTLIALSHLAKLGYRTIAFLVKERKTPNQLVNRLIEQGGAVVDLSKGDNISAFSAALTSNAILLDGILGTGLELPLRGDLSDLLLSLSNLIQNCPGTLKIAIDCPSGVDCDSGLASEATIKADYTLCMAAIKQGLLKFPARTTCGCFDLVDIGIGNIDQYLNEELSTLVDQTWFHENTAKWPNRTDAGHKGTFGTTYIIAGSGSFVGAAYLTGKAAYRSGCGLVHMAALPKVHSALAGHLIEAVWTSLESSCGYFKKASIQKIKADLEKCHSVVLGPGWGISEHNGDFLVQLLPQLMKDTPVLFDADALKLLAGIKDWWKKIPKKSVLTPHPGEMAILIGGKIEDVQENRWEIARKYAMDWQVVLILKGAMTVMACPNGNLLIFPFSDSALATAGSGDVLAGFIGGLLAQGFEIEDAAASGVWLHGAAGLLAAQSMGSSRPVMALDILNHLHHAHIPHPFERVLNYYFYRKNVSLKA